MKLMMETFLEKSRLLFNNNAEITWVSESFLKRCNVSPWFEMPLWIPETYPLSEELPAPYGDIDLNNFKALKQGLTFWPLEETLKDTHDWILEESPF